MNNLIKFNRRFITYSYELNDIIDNNIHTLVLCNLINKFLSLSDGSELNKDGSIYHFYFFKKIIYKDELKISQNTYDAALKNLEEKGFIRTFSNRAENNKLKNVTYFWVNIKLINSILGNKDVQEEKPKAEEKETLKQPENKPKHKEKEYASNTVTLNPIIKEKLADLEVKFKCRFIDEEQYAFQKLIIMQTAAV